MGRNYLAHTQGDAINAILAAARYNFSLLLRWLGRFVALDRRIPEPAEPACRVPVKFVRGRRFRMPLKCASRMSTFFRSPEVR